MQPVCADLSRRCNLPQGGIDMRQNILLCGVGGQGTVLASKLLAYTAMEKGLPVMSAETIGMAQKGGSVFSHLRIGEGICTPMISFGEADLLIGFEPAEAVRMLPYLHPDGTAIVCTTPVVPVQETLKENAYDGTDAIAYLKDNVSMIRFVDGEKACAELGSPRILNMVLLGEAIRMNALPFSIEDIQNAMQKFVKPQFININTRALHYTEENV